MSITTIVTSIVTILASIEQVNTPQERCKTTELALELFYFRPSCGENTVEYFEKCIILIRHPLNVIISMHDETHRTPFFENGGYDLDHIAAFHAPLETFLSRRFLSQKSHK